MRQHAKNWQIKHQYCQYSNCAQCDSSVFKYAMVTNHKAAAAEATSAENFAKCGKVIQHQCAAITTARESVWDGAQLLKYRLQSTEPQAMAAIEPVATNARSAGFAKQHRPTSKTKARYDQERLLVPIAVILRNQISQWSIILKRPEASPHLFSSIKLVLNSRSGNIGYQGRVGRPAINVPIHHERATR